MTETICLDLDGVLVSFFASALKVHKMTHLIKDWPAGHWSMHERMGITEAEFWRPLSRPGFWLELEPYSWAVELFHMLRSHGRVVVCTSPSHDPLCAAEKTEWIQRFIGRDFRDYLIGAPKELMGKPGTVLVDDNDRNCAKFEAAGGRAILFPQIWNAAYAQRFMDKVKFVREQL